MSYQVKEIFYTLQGEGANSGRAAVFCRFSGCNLWSGREEDRAEAKCKFCDTDFRAADAGSFESADDLAERVASLWPSSDVSPFVVCTGGEPLLQLDEALITAFHARGFEVAVETNGTVTPPHGIDWICVSPKAGTKILLSSGDELKLAFPQDDLKPEQLEDLDFRYYYLQPIDSAAKEHNLHLAIQYCLGHPRWRLSLQTHKLVGIQ